MDDAARKGYDWAVIRDGDSMVAEGEALEWLMHQLIEWPRRVDPERTTNDSFLRCSAARTLEALRARLDAEIDVEAVARALCISRGLSPDTLYEHHEWEDWPVDDRREYYDGSTCQIRVSLMHRGWRKRVKDAEAAIAAMRSAQPIEARSVGTACGLDLKDESGVLKGCAQVLPQAIRDGEKN